MTLFFKVYLCMLIFFLGLGLLCGDQVAASISESSEKYFGNIRNGTIAAFGDFNADKATDIFILTDDGSLSLLLASSNLLNVEPFSRKLLIPSSKLNGTNITSVVPADFDGNSQMDVLVTVHKPDETGHDVLIFWGDPQTGELADLPLQVSEKFRDQPAVIDVNGDAIPDLFGENLTGSRFYWIFNTSRHYLLEPQVNAPSSSFLQPQTTAFVDINGDLTADLCIMVKNGTETQLEIWLNQNGSLIHSNTISLPPGIEVVGQTTYVDLDDDHSIDLLLPACLDKDCLQSAIFVWANGMWSQLPVDFKSADKTWKFIPSGPSLLPHLTLPLTLRVGDLNLDGYPDAVAILNSSAGENSTVDAFVLENVYNPANNTGFTRTFQINFQQSLLRTPEETPLLITFFDLLEDGVLDFVATSVSNKKSTLHALKQQFEEDACFMKVMVTSGRCLDDCSAHHKPYGVNQIGPSIRFQTTTSNGDTQIGAASQLSQTAYFALQLPFVVFGLGQMPNFIDTLQVGLPYSGNSGPRNQTWTSIIPNAQLVVIPYPLSEPRSWTNKLFVTPSRLVLLTGAALLGTCVFIACIVGILHWRERIEDKREKLQEAHRFHFDAM